MDLRKILGETSPQEALELQRTAREAKEAKTADQATHRLAEIEENGFYVVKDRAVGNLIGVLYEETKGHLNLTTSAGFDLYDYVLGSDSIHHSVLKRLMQGPGLACCRVLEMHDEKVMIFQEDTTPVFIVQFWPRGSRGKFCLGSHRLLPSVVETGNFFYYVAKDMSKEWAEYDFPEGGVAILDGRVNIQIVQKYALIAAFLSEFRTRTAVELSSSLYQRSQGIPFLGTVFKARQ